MGLKLRDELSTTPPKLVLSSLPTHKPTLESLATLTPPFQPMVSVPFEWEEAPGRPRPVNLSSPIKPKSVVRCLELPPRLLVEGKMVNVPSSPPTTVLDGPRVGRSLSHRFCFEETDLGLVGNGDGVGPKGKNDLRSHFGSCRWASGNDMKWNQDLRKGNLDISLSYESEVDIKVKLTRFRRRSRRSLYRLSYSTSHLLESICERFKHIIIRRRKQ